MLIGATVLVTAEDLPKGGVYIRIEDLARAWASIDGKRDEFDAKGDDGHYDGYLAEANEQLVRAVKYARERNV